ncbi:cytochrome P450 [Frankia sp. Mgl5]|uniref:cytochrome P450 n=1 Tax=Frankia sp. Mgl5 TaxID=2933793 RepID=UPI00200E151E|nr:cytochrome P450 [Frankia sp. Mgl5]MCK9931988.1 cytochrome P450 [Frankia sp. Mgl5]
MTHDRHVAREPWNNAADDSGFHPSRYDRVSKSLFVYSASRVADLLRDDRLWNRRPEYPPFELMQSGEEDAARKFYEFTLLWPAFSDGAYHERIRPALVEGLAGAVNPRAKQLFAQAAESLIRAGTGRRIDWVGEVVWPYSVRVLSIVFGIDANEAESIARLGAVVLDAIGSPSVDGHRFLSALSAAEELERWLGRSADAPSSRLLAALAHIHEDPELGPAVATALLTQVVTGSIEPLVSGLCVLAERVGNDDLGQLAIAPLREEVFRLATPFRYAARYARCPLEIDGHPVASGDRVVLHLATANMDPSAVPDPTAMRDRGRFPHLAFGLGSHYCPGAGIARAAVDAVLATMKAQAVVFHLDSLERAPGESILRYKVLTGALR